MKLTVIDPMEEEHNLVPRAPHASPHRHENEVRVDLGDELDDRGARPGYEGIHEASAVRGDDDVGVSEVADVVGLKTSEVHA